MKKNVSSILVLVMALVLMLNFFGCEKLKVSNLKANYQLKKANKFYTEEKYKDAYKAYEKALELNPKLESIYIYLGTSYSSLYRPMKTGDRNKMYGEKAVEYLLKAKEYDPENENVTIALGDIYDKMGDFEQAEKYYLEILEKAKDDPKSYYTLASFYSKNSKPDSADEMYRKRIELEPENPEGYHYYVGFLQDQRRWSDAITAHEKRLYAMLDPDIVKTMLEIEKLQNETVEVKKIVDLMEKIKKNKRVDQAEKQRLLDESKQKLEGKLLPEEAEKKIEELNKTLKEQIKLAEATIDGMDEQKKQQIAEAYYSIGNVCWNWSYQTHQDYMSAQERDPIIEKGIECLKKAIKIAPDYPNPYSYIGLLYREKIKVEPLKSEEYIKLNNEYNKKFMNIYKRRQKSEAFRKELEEMGKEGDEEVGGE